QGAVEGSGHGQAYGALGPRLLAQLRRAVHRRRVAGDHDLSGRVDVRGRDDLALRGLAAGLLDGGKVQGQDGRHRALPDRNRLLHVLAAAANGHDGVAQRQDAGGDEGRIFAQAVAGHPLRLHPPRGQGARGRDARGQDRGLGVRGELELVLRSFEAQPRQGEAQGAVGLVEYGAALGYGVVEGPPHADLLRSLAREDEGEGHELLVSVTCSLRGPRTRSSASIRPFTPLVKKSAAVRMPCLMATALERPWPITQHPFTPRRGAPPYSEGSMRWRTALNAPLERKAPTLRTFFLWISSLMRRMSVS